MTNVCIVGAGAMGCLFAARLAAVGVAVTLIDVDRPRLAAIEAGGVTLEDDDGIMTVTVTARLAADATGSFDVVVFFTKGQHTEAAVASVAHLATPDAYAVTLQNGLGNAERIAAVFAADRILIGATDYPADLVAPTRVASHGRGSIWLGRFDGGAVPDGIAAALRSAGFAVAIDPAILASIWEKVAFNAALNSLATVTGLTVGEMDTPAGRRIADAVVTEVAATAATRAIAVNIDSIRAKVDHAFATHRDHKASMLQDRLAGRQTEIESINGEIVRMATAAGRAVPVTATLADLVRMIELAKAISRPPTLD